MDITTEINKIKVMLCALWEDKPHPEARALIEGFKEDIEEIRIGEDNKMETKKEDAINQEHIDWLLKVNVEDIVRKFGLKASTFKMLRVKEVQYLEKLAYGVMVKR